MTRNKNLVFVIYSIPWVVFTGYLLLFFPSTLGVIYYIYFLFYFICLTSAFFKNRFQIHYAKVRSHLYAIEIEVNINISKNQFLVYPAETLHLLRLLSTNTWIYTRSSLIPQSELGYGMPVNYELNEWSICMFFPLIISLLRVPRLGRISPGKLCRKEKVASLHWKR